MMRATSFTVILLITELVAKENEEPIVEIDDGIVRGTRDTSRSGRTFFAFKGIPYSKPPLGNLRFKPPQPVEPWNGILNTQHDAPHCLQKNYLFAYPKIEGGEDCLYLNVYTPRLRMERYAKDHLLPVMVFIHWGGFFAGYSSSDYLGPQYLMDKDVILVTFNYRLGVLGFFSTGDDASPGNYGLKDQVAALKWVQKNIKFFGGNKNKVTIFGQSAGGASVHYHMVSPGSRNLFSRSISMSGTALALWAKPFPLVPPGLVKQQAELVGCQNTIDNQAIVDCLTNVSALDLLKSGDHFKFFSIDPLNVYQPVVERESEKNPNPFITKTAVEYIRNNEFAKVPWIIGLVNDEGLVRASALLRQSKTRGLLNDDFNNLMPHLMGLWISTPPHSISALWTQIKNFYFTGKNKIDINDSETIKGLVNLYTDRSFAYSAYQTALFHSIKGHDDIWFYRFNYSGSYSYGNIFAATKEDIGYRWGVSHCDDLIYLFKSPAVFDELKDNNDRRMSKLMVELWTNFATYGEPTPWFETSLEPWERINNHTQETALKSLNHYNFNGTYDDNVLCKPVNRLGIYGERFKFWEKIPLLENIRELNETHIEL